MIKKIKLQNQLFVSMLGLSGLIVVLLWLFQILLFPSVYRLLKTNQVVKMNQLVVSTWPTADTNLDMMARRNDACILVVSNEQEILAVTNPLDCVFSQLKKTDIAKLISLADQNNGLYEVEIRQDGMPMERMGMRRQGMTRVIYVDTTLEQVAVLSSGNLMPLEATERLLGSIILTLSIILVVASFVVSVLLSKYLAKPIEELNHQVLQLGQGDYQTKFSDSKILEIAQLGASLTHSAQKLGTVDKLRNELIANVSHDFKTPLTMIKGYAEMMRDLPKEKTQENLQIIIQEADYLNLLVDDVLKLSLIEAKGENLQKSHIDLSSLLHEIIDKHNHLNQLQIVTEIELDIIIQADLIKLKQIIQNLLVNALQHAKQSVMVRVVSKQDKVRISIINDGDLLDQELQDKIWERYYRNQAKPNSNGLGLAIVKKLVELHKGQVAVSCDSGMVEFIIELPTD